jgi:acyl-CoA synthetase (AMP-forming)/AMP-acid ligase II
MGANDVTAKLLGDWMRHWAEAKPDELALVYGDQRYTWAQWQLRVSRLVSALADAGVRRGDRVAFLDKNHPACVELTHAAAALGAANAVPNWRLAGDELDYVFADSAPKVVLVGAELAANVHDRLSTVDKVVVVGGAEDEYESWIAGYEPSPGDPAVTDNDVCMVMYSSGTTGRPKGVMLTQRNLIAHTVNSVEDFEFSDGDMNLVAMPLFHVGGSSYVLVGICKGMPTIMTREADPASLFGALEAGATHAFLVPAVVAAAFAAGEQAVAALGRLKRFAYGASPMPLPLLRKALAAWPATDFLQVYGLTELAGVITTLTPQAHRSPGNERRLASAGTPIPGAEMRVVDPATMADVSQGETGELWFRSAQVMAGYLNKPEATKESIVDGGWLRTGDIGYVDDGGYVFISDRVKDMIITGGENVYSPEVERVLAEHEGVEEVAVIGIPDERWGETVKAVVTARPGAALDEETLIEWCRGKLAKFKCPRSVDVVEALPRNPTGKILKKTLREPYWRGRERQV